MRLFKIAHYVHPADTHISNRYISNIEMPGGTIRYVPLQPPKNGDTRTSSASEWTIDMDVLEKTFNAKTKMIVSNIMFR